MRRGPFTRREVVASGAALAGALAALPHPMLGRAAAAPGTGAADVNDIHSKLNATRVDGILRPESPEHLVELVTRAAQRGCALSVAGGRHAMGGQQFGAGTDLVDMTALDRIISLDRHNGILEAEGGAMWPAAISHCWNEQRRDAEPWAIVQKQTGADALTLGGALAANVHGRGLAMRPIIQDVDSFTLVTPGGEEVECSRSRNPERFALAIGGYGLFGIISRVRLRLMPRLRLRRVVTLIDVDDLVPELEGRIRGGYLYGDFQYMTDPASPDFLRKGVLSCYLPVDDRDGGDAAGHRELSLADWKSLYRLAFFDRAAAFETYARYYLGTNGQLYWSDRHQLSTYLGDYHIRLHEELGFPHTVSLMISELYVPRLRLAAFMDDVRRLAADEDMDIVYGTIRLIRKDGESYLAWAKDDYACIIFNLRVFHTPDGLEKAKRDFRALIDVALAHEGSYYLTYHRWARRDQVLAGYPDFPEFLRRKREHDPQQVFRSDWYTHHRAMFS